MFVTSRKKNVELDILMTMEEVILKNLSQESETKKSSLTEPERIRLLSEAGFTSNPELVKYQEKVNSRLKGEELEQAVREELLGSFKLLLKAREVYGDSTLLVPFDQFSEICKRHNLVCGGLDEFIGNIPDDKLQEIVELQNKKVIREIIPLHSVYEVRFTGSGSGSSGREKEEVNQHLSDSFPFLRHCSPNRKNVTFADGHTQYCSFTEFNCGELKNFFMCAPEKMFSERRKIKHIWDRRIDPIVCALSSRGVFCFTRWGEEASDKVIKAHELIGKKISECKQRFLL